VKVDLDVLSAIEHAAPYHARNVDEEEEEAVKLDCGDRGQGAIRGLRKLGDMRGENSDGE
jgi:hypothetical protein